ncbi:MAG: RidA family protein [Polynucleobacter sp.]|nr:RidA family protein [Polynucleobacter sp.]
MGMQQHNPSTIAAPLGAYSNGVSAPGGGRWLYIAGQIGVHPDGSMATTFVEQADAAWANVVAILADAGMTIQHLVKVTHYLVRPDDLKDYNPVRSRHLGAALPASTLIFAQALAKPDWLFEVEAVAWRA